MSQATTVGNLPDLSIMPYKGLMPYSEEDSPYFFGREAEREIITANLEAARLTVLYGESGCGKTSVLHAGVAHRLRQLAQRNLLRRGSPEFAVVVFSAWRDDPVRGLVRRIRESVSDVFGAPLRPGPPNAGLVEVIEEQAEGVGGPILVILDQFEEYFLYHQRGGADERFALEFSRAVNRRDLPANFLISIREDALARLDRFKGRIPTLLDNYLRIDHLTREGARAAIERPLERYRDVTGRSMSVEPFLVEAVLDQVQAGRVSFPDPRGRGQGLGLDGAGELIQTPYLQLVLTRLWSEETSVGSGVLRLQTLERLGGAERIVRTHLDEVMRGLRGDEQEVAARVFHHLVTPSGTKVAHSPSDLAEYAHVNEPRLKPVLEELSRPNMRILRPVPPPLDQPSIERFEIFHDVLAPAVLDWRDRYLRARSERRRRRRLRIAWAVGLVLLSILTVTGYLTGQRSASVLQSALVTDVTMEDDDIRLRRYLAEQGVPRREFSRRQLGLDGYQVSFVVHLSGFPAETFRVAWSVNDAAARGKAIPKPRSMDPETNALFAKGVVLIAEENERWRVGGTIVGSEEETSNPFKMWVPRVTRPGKVFITIALVDSSGHPVAEASTRSFEIAPDLILKLQPGTFTVTNIGQARAGPLVVEVRGIGRFDFQGLDSGDSETGTFSCVGGSVTAVVDPDGQVAEAREDNNLASSECGPVLLPDLAIELHAGSFTVTNIGGVGAGPYAVDLEGIGRFDFQGLDPGASETGTFSCVGGSVTAVVDPDGQVAEAREDNNVASSECLPDLVIELQPGSFIVSNIGGVPAGPFLVEVQGVGTFDIHGLEPSESASRPFRCTEGIVTAVVDPGGQVAEADENNNSDSVALVC